MKLSKKAVLVTGAVVALAVPTVAAATAHAGSAQIGTPDCYVEVDYLDPNVTIGGTRPPCSLPVTSMMSWTNRPPIF